MARLNVVKIGDSVLREKCMEVHKFNDNLHRLLDNMAETMYAEQGVGLAAPQVGIPKRVVVIDTEGELIELVNPVIVESSGNQTGEEGCLSIPGEYEEVSRAAEVTVRGQDREGREITLTGSGMLARAIQHEIDHLDGVLFVDRVRKG